MDLANFDWSQASDWEKRQALIEFQKQQLVAQMK